MISAIVLIQSNYSSIPEVKRQVRKIVGLDFLYEIIDSYNLVLKLSAETKEELKDKVTEIINLREVLNVLSLIILS
ncbi:MAG TPA: hypothetical protein VF884_00510 [Nitrososphaeraceae archaeon]